MRNGTPVIVHIDGYAPLAGTFRIKGGKPGYLIGGGGEAILTVPGHIGEPNSPISYRIIARDGTWSTGSGFPSIVGNQTEIRRILPE